MRSARRAPRRRPRRRRKPSAGRLRPGRASSRRRRCCAGTWAVANYRFSSDLLADVLFRAGEFDPDGVSVSGWQAQALVYLNRAYQSLWMGGSEFTQGEVNEDWWWLRAPYPGVLILRPQHELLGSRITSSATVSLVDAVGVPDYTGWWLSVAGHEDAFRVVDQGV